MGISMALAGARQAAGLLARALRGDCELDYARREYAKWRSGMFLHYHDFGKLFRSLVTTRAGSAVLVGAMRLLPAVADRLFGSVAEMRPWPARLWKTPEDSPLWRPASETVMYFRHGGGSQGATE
jgi:hypothetical protein